MSTQWTEAEAQKALQTVAKRSATDAAFRRLALSNPGQAIKEAGGKEVPAGFKVRFVENQGANLTVVLPDPVAKGGELSDSEVEQVAGGGGRCGASCAASCIVSSAL